MKRRRGPRSEPRDPPKSKKSKIRRKAHGTEKLLMRGGTVSKTGAIVDLDNSDGLVCPPQIHMLKP